jgi:hypothetical protein
MVDTMTWVSAESQGNVVQLPTGGRHFSCLQNIRTSSMVYPVSYSMGTGRTFPRSKADGA